MLDQSVSLKEMNLSIQQERKDIKQDSAILSERKKALKEKETEYLKLTLVEFQNKQ